MKPSFNIDKVKLMLEKYYQGQTTLEEEHELRMFFSSAQVPPEFATEKELFCTFNYNENINIARLNESIQAAIRIASNDAINNNRSIKRKITWISIAASVLIIISLCWMFSRQQQHYELVDTYDDPYLAYQHTREVIQMVSGKLNIAISELESLSALNNSMQKLEPIEQVTKQLDNISRIDRISKPVYYLSKPMKTKSM